MYPIISSEGNTLEVIIVEGIEVYGMEISPKRKGLTDQRLSSENIQITSEAA